MQTLTTDYADLLAKSSKTIHGLTKWVPKRGAKRASWRLDAPVLCSELKTELRLQCYCSEYSYGFTLLYQNERIRGTGTHKSSHFDPVTRKWCDEYHKHRWTTEHGDKSIYIPDDIDFSNVNRAFRGFMGECNIVLVDGYLDLLVPE